MLHLGPLIVIDKLISGDKSSCVQVSICCVVIEQQMSLCQTGSGGVQVSEG